MSKVSARPDCDPFASVRGVPIGEPRRWPSSALPAGCLVELGRQRLPDALTDNESDQYAVALGLHPVEVWPDWHDA